jgi:hypothetical protein
MKFRDLQIGDSFDFIKPHSHLNSFYSRCVKVSTRQYTDDVGYRYSVGAINVEVYNVERKK